MKPDWGADALDKIIVKSIHKNDLGTSPGYQIVKREKLQVPRILKLNTDFEAPCCRMTSTVWV